MQIVIAPEKDGMCLRELIKQELHISVKMLKYLKYQNRGISVNGEVCTVRRILHTGDIVELELEDRDSSLSLTPVPLPLEILYEDENIVIPSKSAEMPTHPSHGHHDDTVANALAYRYAQNGTPFVFRPINRLDRNTSGLLLIARNKLAAGNLSKFMQDGRIRKTYLALLDGEIQGDGGVIDACLHRTAESIIVREVCASDTPDAAPARTEYQVLAVQNGHTLVEAHPITGRTHQLRVHFASIGHPIMGDDLYGTPSPLIARHALHASDLYFPHPTKDIELHIHAPLPADMQTVIDSIFSKKELPYVPINP